MAKRGKEVKVVGNGNIVGNGNNITVVPENPKSKKKWIYIIFTIIIAPIIVYIAQQEYDKFRNDRNESGTNGSGIQVQDTLKDTLNAKDSVSKTQNLENVTKEHQDKKIVGGISKCDTLQETTTTKSNIKITGEGTGNAMFNKEDARKQAYETAMNNLLSKFSKEKEIMVRCYAQISKDTTYTNRFGTQEAKIVLFVNESDIK